MNAASALDPWTAEVAYLTREYREERAAELSRKGKARRDGWRLYRAGEFESLAVRAALEQTHGGFPVPAGLPGSVWVHGAWHASRARGHRERFERVGQCQQLETIEVHCKHCGHTEKRGLRCRVALACVSCRGKIANEKRSRLAASRRAALDLIAKRGLTRKTAPGGRWTEKLCTFTIPHVPMLGLRDRARWVQAAWPHFARSWNLFLARHPVAGKFVDRQGYRLARWFRNLEWTPGSDGLGHPHIHMWYVGPFLRGGSAKDDPRSSVLRNLWRDALRIAAKDFPELGETFTDEEGVERAGAGIGPARLPALRAKGAAARVPSWHWRAEITGLDRLFVDVRMCPPGKGSLQEVLKYLFKDLGKDRRKIAPELWAAVYESFDGKRTTQGSRGLMSLPERERLLSGFAVNERTGEVREIQVEDLPDLPASVRGKPCFKCGTRGAWEVRRRQMTDEERHALDARRPLKKAQLPFLREVKVS